MGVDRVRDGLLEKPPWPLHKDPPGSTWWILKNFAGFCKKFQDFRKKGDLDGDSQNAARAGGDLEGVCRSLYSPGGDLDGVSRTPAG